MKEVTLTSAHVAESFQSVIDWNAVRNNVSVIARKSLIFLRHEATPWVLTLFTVALMCYGIAIGSDMLCKSSAIASIVPFAWGLLIELKNTNPDEL